MKFSIYTDLHLKPSGSGYDLDQVGVPADIDAVLISGDLTHRANPEDIELAQDFISRLEGVPVLYIPGNHDHAPMATDVVDSFDYAHAIDRESIEFDEITVIGYGCHNRTLERPLDQRDYEALDPEKIDPNRRRYMANKHADHIEAVCYDLICDDLTLSEAIEELEIRSHEEATFRSAVQSITETYQEITSLLANQSNILFLTHVPPFNTTFDHHHAIGDRHESLENLHVGSIPIKLAIRTHDVRLSVSGHSHNFGYDVFTHRVDIPPVHYLNLGYRGIGSATVRPGNDDIVFERRDSE